MKFHFRSHDHPHHGGGDGDGSALLVLEAKPPGAATKPPPSVRPRALFRLSRRAAPPCGGLTSDSSDDEAPPPDPRPRDGPGRRAPRGGPFGLRRPTLRRRRAPPGPPSPARARAPPPAAAPAPADPGLAPARRRVAFATVHTREYATVLGDHPCCSSGLPLALGWDLVREGAVALDAHERARAGDGPGARRGRDRLRLGGEARRAILLNVAGPPGEGGEGAARYTRRELERAERRLARDRAGLNARMALRQNKRFFRAAPAREGEGARGAGAPAAEEAQGGAPCPTAPAGEAAAPMDISPVKAPVAT